ncbi:MAG: cysteine--tRNA ligase [Candidatus Omnitrophica bacterium]|nr:cysteine--tRNA ligase [Candidatus Omnitrophota bacterium]
MIRFFNTLSGKTEEFRPLQEKEKEVGMYTCGPTVYDYAHIGNFRAFIFEDLLRRFLEYKGYKVKHVMNITDVDDKTIAGANREKKKLGEFTETYTRAFREDLQALNILPANYPKDQPRATQEIPAMIELIEKLVKKGTAYVNDGSVYYRVTAFPSYGKLSKKKLDKNIQGVRVDVDAYEKEDGADFALWKKAKEEEPAWDSPWGKGRPGWHIECSAMSMKYLGETFDIHAGGEDLIFPHHENEIAQSEGATGKPFVKYWLHCKFLLVNGEKMSKSKGNFYTLRDLLTKGHDPMTIRYVLLSTHYRTPLNFTLEGVKSAGEAVERLTSCYAHCLHLNVFGIGYKVKVEDLTNWNVNLCSCLPDARARIEQALENDLNISVALAEVFDALKLINFCLSKKLLEEKSLKEAIDFFKRVDRLLGLKITEQEALPPDVFKYYEQRSTFRRDPRFIKDKTLQQLADDLRAKIESLGWIVKDGRPGEPSTLQKKRRAWEKV